MTRCSRAQLAPYRPEGDIALPDWGRAECRRRGLPSSAFFYEDYFPRSSKEYNRAREFARSVCLACPVREPCAEYAIVTNQHGGMWGAMTWGERCDERARRFREAQLTLQGPLAAEQTETRERPSPQFPVGGQ